MFSTVNRHPGVGGLGSGIYVCVLFDKCLQDEQEEPPRSEYLNKISAVLIVMAEMRKDFIAHKLDVC